MIFNITTTSGDTLVVDGSSKSIVTVVANGIKGERGLPFIYDDFTAEQLAALKGVKGDKGDAFVYEDFTSEQLAGLKGEKGDQGVQGVQGEKGDKGDTGSTGAQGESPPVKSGTGTIPITGWVANTGDYAYKLDLAITGIESSDVIQVAVNPDDMDTATTAQLCPTNDSYAGGITFYAKTVPADTIGFSYFSVVTTSQYGGDFTKYFSYSVNGTLGVDTDIYPIISGLAMTVKEILISVETAPTGADLIIDINKNGTTMYTTQANRPTIPAGSTTATVSLPNIISIAKGDKITIDIDQVGSTNAGENLSLTIICEV